jgi:hypothetical protein
MTVAAISWAVTSFKAPPIFPMGVLAPSTMTTSFILNLLR